jgi:hypothetical protein
MGVYLAAWEILALRSVDTAILKISLSPEAKRAKAEDIGNAFKIAFGG